MKTILTISVVSILLLTYVQSSERFLQFVKEGEYNPEKDSWFEYEDEDKKDEKEKEETVVIEEEP